jgi:hypothetical protein
MARKQSIEEREGVQVKWKNLVEKGVHLSIPIL